MAKAKKKAVKTAKKASSPKASVPIMPVDDNVVVKPLSPEEMGTTTASGIIIPDTAQEKPEQGTVVAVGPGKWNEDGDMRIPVSVEVGDRVLFSKYGYEEVKIAGVEYYVLSANNIKAVIK
jgi:chaperonin GroES